MQGPALRIAKEMGLETVAADAAPDAPCAGLADRFERVDLKDKEGIEKLARRLMAEGGLSGVMTAGTDFSASVAWAAERLGLPGIPYEAALDASDKERMRRRFKEAGVPSPRFIIVSGALDAAGIKVPFGFPLVVKPVDNMGSRGCRRVDSPAELESAVRGALGFSRSGRAIVEEYMEGPEFSVDALVFKGEITICGFADRHIFFPPYFIEMGHTMPCRTDGPSPVITEEEQKALLSAFCLGVKALGIDNGAAKGDIKLTPLGPMIGEIAARLSGGYMSGWTYPYSSGVEPTRGAIQIALGQKPDCLEPVRHWTCAERAFISIPGKARSISGIEEAKAVPGVKDLFMRVKEGSALVFPENNVTKSGNVLALAPARDEACAAAEKAARSVLIRLEAPNSETDAFLSGAGGEGSVETRVFPPGAFKPDARLRGLLDEIPEGNPAPVKDIAIIAFPELAASGLKDYMGRSVEESLEAVRAVTGLALPVVEKGGAKPCLGRAFWAALIRGGYQGAAYFIDKIGLDLIEKPGVGRFFGKLVPKLTGFWNRLNMFPLLARLIIFALLVFFAVRPLPAQVLTLENALKDLGSRESGMAELRWDPFFASGVISSGGHDAAFISGARGEAGPVLLDRRDILNLPLPYTEGGALVFPESFVAGLKSAFARYAENESGRYRIAAIIIDPGHGGKDTGAVGEHIFDGKPYKLLEKDLVLNAALYLHGRLRQAFPDKRVLLTRSGDTFPSLEERAALANSVTLKDNEAIIYISIHANASFKKDARGYEVWYLSQGYRRNVLDKSRYEDDSIFSIENDMMQEEYTTESILMAQSILKRMGEAAGRTMPSRGLKEEEWFVVRNVHMPSVLVELGFVTNEKDAALMRDDAYLKNLAEALYKGITDFIGLFERSGGFTR
jgi:N-acetylmuramoyl-L-alanine amidase/biotin carboxylase